ncbi:Wall-associated receptor kinase, galacturonan-binding domain [Dillenia turbinata]|uniref:Wall-associated receptor kinase, galacturonan-binding domain n=1 Tax=Dillenia turbinata TaxID=194707 RepID=A0AAN8VE80_9MAGN
MEGLCNARKLTFFFFMVVIIFAEGVDEDEQRQHECANSESKSCNIHGPSIRFPFRRKDAQGQTLRFAHPVGFDLSCTAKKETMLELPNSVKLQVYDINYTRQIISVYNDDDCLPQLIRSVNLSPFQFHPQYSWDRIVDYAFFSCPSGSRDDEMKPISCLSTTTGYEIYAWDPSSAEVVPFLHCTKNFTMTSLPRGACRKLTVAGIVLGSVILVTVVAALYHVHRSKKLDKQSQLKIEKFLEDYRSLKPARYSYADIKRITDQFKDELGEGAYGTVYKGKLSNEVFVAIKILNNTTRDGEEFINEVGTMGRIHHVNVVRLAGYCADGFRRALVYEYLPNGSLENFTSSTNSGEHLLGWEKLEDIALGIAKDVYSFGMLLLEMVGGRKVASAEGDTSETYFPEWVYNHLDQCGELGIQIKNDRHAQIAKKLTIVGLWCIQWYPVDRPSMRAVVKMLEGEGENMIVPPNPFGSKGGPLKTGQTSRAIPSRAVNRELETISEQELEK